MPRALKPPPFRYCIGCNTTWRRILERSARFAPVDLPAGAVAVEGVGIRWTRHRFRFAAAVGASLLGVGVTVARVPMDTPSPAVRVKRLRPGRGERCRSWRLLRGRRRRGEGRAVSGVGALALLEEGEQGAAEHVGGVPGKDQTVGELDRFGSAVGVAMVCVQAEVENHFAIAGAGAEVVAVRHRQRVRVKGRGGRLGWIGHGQRSSDERRQSIWMSSANTGDVLTAYLLSFAGCKFHTMTNDPSTCSGVATFGGQAVASHFPSGL